MTGLLIVLGTILIMSLACATAAALMEEDDA